MCHKNEITLGCDKIISTVFFIVFSILALEFRNLSKHTLRKFTMKEKEIFSEYATRHSEPHDYLLATMFDGASIDPNMEVKNLSTDYNLKIPHFADIIYSVIKRKDLDLQTVFTFITMGQNTNGHIKVIDTQLTSSIKTIDQLDTSLRDLGAINKANLRMFILDTFPGKSRHADHPMNPGLSEIKIVRMYLTVMIKFCEEDSLVAKENINKHNEALKNEPLERKSYEATKKGCLGVFVIITFWVVLSSGSYLLITHLLSS